MPPTSPHVEAIVLKVSPVGEADLLVDFLSREMGRMTGVARHARKSKVRFGTLLEPFNLLQIRLKEKKGLAFLEEATLRAPLNHLSERLDRLRTAFYLIDCIRTALPERDPEPKVFDLLAESLQALDSAGEPQSGRLRFEYRLMRLLGFAPRLESCARCRRTEDPSWFVFKEGALFCRGCLPAGSASVRLSAAALRSLAGIEGRAPLGAAPGTASLSFPSNVVEELDQFLPKHLEYHLGRAPRSTSVLRPTLPKDLIR